MTQKLKYALLNEGRPLEAFIGCTDEEIQQVMQAQSVKRLPKTFIEYLQVMGHGGISEILLGDRADYSYSSMLFLKNVFIEEVESYSPNFTLPDDVFVFFGYEFGFGHESGFRYFLTDGSVDDPPVFLHIIGTDDAKLVGQSFSEYLVSLLHLYRKLNR